MPFKDISLSEPHLAAPQTFSSAKKRALVWIVTSSTCQGHTKSLFRKQIYLMVTKANTLNRKHATVRRVVLSDMLEQSKHVNNNFRRQPKNSAPFSLNNSGRFVQIIQLYVVNYFRT